MGQACSRTAHRSAAIAPLPPAVAGQALVPGSASSSVCLPAALAAANAALHRHAGPSAPQAAALLNSLLGALLVAAGGLDAADAVRPAPATVEQLVQRLQHGCEAAGCRMEQVAAAAAPLAARLLSHSSSQRRADRARGDSDPAGGRAAPLAAVPAADTLVSWLHTLLFDTVTLDSAARLAHKHRQYALLRDALGCSDAALAACLSPAIRVSTCPPGCARL